MESTQTRAAVFGVLIVLVLGIWGCSSNDHSSPETITRAFVQSISEWDAERGVRCVSTADQALINAREDDGLRYTGKYEIGQAVTAGEAALVPVSYYGPSGKEFWTAQFHCIREQGEWRVNLTGTLSALARAKPDSVFVPASLHQLAAGEGKGEWRARPNHFVYNSSSK